MTVILVRKWWALSVRGLAAVVFGVVALAWPGLTLAALALLFGAYALADGVFAVAAAFKSPAGGERWWALFLEGLAGVVVGLLTFFWPGMTALALLYFIAAWAVATGVLEIAAAVRLRKTISDEWLLALCGVISVMFGVALLVMPVAGALAVVWLIGVYALAFGAILLALSFRLRNLGARARASFRGATAGT